MRKLTSGNKGTFTTFVLIIVIIVALLIFGLISVGSIEKVEYTISSGTFFYDEDYNPVTLSVQATMKKEWNGSYYLRPLDEQKLEYNLGKQVVAYIPGRTQVSLYGDFYKIYSDSSVEKISDENLVNTKDDTIYKLSDRKYLIISNTIKNSTGSIDTEGYLLIIMDKQGNTSLLNHEINYKTINPISIQTNSFTFDKANEKLEIGTKQIDLKKIIGSTNEYVAKEETEKESGTSEADDTQNTQNNVIQYSNTGGGTVINNTSTQVSNGSTNISVSTENISSSNQPTSTGTTNATEISKSVSLRSLSPSTTYIDVEYAVSDPEKKYQVVYLLVETGSQIIDTISLDKTATTYRITNLTPNVEYKITMGYKEIQDNNAIVDKIEDVMTTKTEKLSSSITVTRITQKKIYFNVKIDSSYVYDSAQVVLYADGEAVQTLNVNISNAITSSGWTSSFSYVTASSIVIKLESAVYEGNEVNANVSTKIVNY